MHLTKKFLKGGAGGMNEMLKFVTPDGSLRKKTQKIFAFFAKITQFQDLFKLNFGLKDLF